MELSRPYPDHIGRLVERMRRTDADAVSSPHEGAAALRAPLAAAVERARPELLGLSHDIHGHPELRFEEHHAAAAVAALLGDHGHDAQVGAYGLDTAVRARFGQGPPTVAVIAEFDALPEIGHACGHNVICATAVGAFLALATVADDLDGTIELLATPGEEGGGGKELMARAGAFDDVDAALMVHPSGLDVAEHPWLGVRQVRVTYRGLPAHASMLPFMGRNALDAVVLAYTGIAQLRQHMLPNDRVHGIITDGGSAPNVVPERAAALFYVRSPEPETLLTLSERVEAVLRASAEATGTAVELDWDRTPPYLPVRSNRPLAARYGANLADRERTVWPAGVAPSELAASTDLGNVSVRLPAIHPMLAVAPPDAILHTPEFAAWAGSERADVAVVDGAVALARTAADYLGDAELRHAAAEDFEAQGGRIDVVGLTS